ncbi:MAG: hypothetical protein J2P55_10905, partial [Rhizobiales bacterium]|nr:hypothetical protein [Hyphomicrobiales bacterium]
MNTMISTFQQMEQDFENCQSGTAEQLFTASIGSFQSLIGTAQLVTGILGEAIPPVGIAINCGTAALDIADKLAQAALKDGCGANNPLFQLATVTLKAANAGFGIASGANQLITKDAPDLIKVGDGLRKSLTLTNSAINGFNLNPPPPSMGGGCDDPETESVESTLEAQVQALQQLSSEISSVTSALQTLQSVANNFDTNGVVSALNTIAETGMGSPPNAPFIVTLANGSAIRGTFDAAGGMKVFLPANTKFTINVLDPRLQLVGTATGMTGASGIDTQLPQLQWQSFSDLPSTAGDGVPDVVDQILGINPGTQLVPGMSNLQAIQDGLNQTSTLASTTGIVGSVALQGSAQAVTVVGSQLIGSNVQTAYVAAGTGGLAIIDASNPLSPVLLSETALGGNATGVDVSGNFAAVATGNSLQILDVSESNSPTVLHSIAVNATRVQIFNGTAFVNDGGKIDAYDLATGQLEQSLAVTNLAPNAQPANIVGMTRDGSNLYAVDDQGVLYSLSIGTGNAVSLLGSVRTQVQNGPNGVRLTVSNGTLYLGNGNNNLGPGVASTYQTIDVTNPSAPRILTSITGGNTLIVTGGIAVNGAGVGVTVGVDPTGANILDVVDTTNPSNNDAFVTRFGLPGQPFDVAFGQGFALVADGTSGLQIVNTQAFDTQGAPPSLTIASGPGAGIDPTTLGNTTFNFTEGQSVSFGLTVQDKLPVTQTALLINGVVVATNNNGPTFNLSAVIPSLDTLGDEA